MVNIHADFAIPDSVDLIEGLNGGVTWMQEWDFFEICQVPIGIAMENSHRLAHKESVQFSDLAGEKFLLYQHIGFWKSVCEEYIADTTFLIQPDRETFADLVINYYPALITFKSIRTFDFSSIFVYTD